MTIVATAPGAPTASVAQPDTGVVVDEAATPDHPWVAIVWNDPVNLMSYVTYVFQTLLGHPRAVAERLMLDVHHRGRATVDRGSRDAMEAVVTQLHAAGLWASLAEADSA